MVICNIDGQIISFNSSKVAQLQKRLANMPLVPANTGSRKRRDKLQKQLLEEAHKSGDVSKINLQAGYY
jgi:hypothetical protein